MSNERRPIDDPEVRQQHRRQAGRRALDCFRAPFSVALFFFVMVAGAVSCDGAFGTRVPVTVDLVDASKSSVRVVSSDPEISGWYDVDDTGSYAVGDRVGVILTGEDNTPSDLDREPVLPRVMRFVLLFGSLAAIVTALRMPRLVLRTSRRHRALAEPWRPVRATFIEGHLVSLPGAQGSTHWRVDGAACRLPRSGHIRRAESPAQDAGS